jgi:hypothetical protein
MGAADAGSGAGHQRGPTIHSQFSAHLDFPAPLPIRLMPPAAEARQPQASNHRPLFQSVPSWDDRRLASSPSLMKAKPFA